MLADLEAALEWFIGLLFTPFQWILDGVVYALKTVICFILDAVLNVILLFLQGIDFIGGLALQFVQFANLPPQAIYLLQAMGIFDFISIIASAYLIRLLLNLIPAAFTRL